MKTTSYRVSDELFLVQRPVGSPKQAAPKKAAPPPIHHILVFDCSGSMYYDLPKIRAQMKKRLPALLGEEDLLSAIWFSGRDEFGVLFEAEPVPTLKDLAQVSALIDRWLRPICLTGFLQPLQETTSLVARVGKKNPRHTHALLFLSDGYDNQWNRNDILSAVEKAGAVVSAATFVEYGFYADRPLLTRMAEKAGGTLIFSEDFDKYAPLFEAHIQRKLSGAPRVEINVEGDVIGGFAFALVDGDLVSFDAGDGKVAVPEDLDELWYLSPTVVGSEDGDVAKLSEPDHTPVPKAHKALDASYAAVSLFSLRAQPKILLPLLKALGDVKLIEQFGGLFGKQAYTEFMEASKAAAFESKQRWLNGWDPTKVPRDDAFTVLDLLRILAEDEDNHVLLDSDDFKYKRIGRSDEVVLAEGQEALKFEADSAPGGYSVSNLTFNETRPNVSILVKKTGTVDLKARLKGSGFEKKLPPKFPTFVFRNYTMIRDGIVNVDRLPVRMTKETIQELEKAGFPMSAIVPGKGETKAQVKARLKKASKARPVNVVIDLRALPVINRNMVKDVSAEAMFRKQLALMKARGAQKVFNSIMKDKFPRESEGFKILYGDEAADWLKEQGITDYSGFGPKTKKVDAKDSYTGKELKISLKGISSLPSLEEVQKKMASGKMTPRFELMVPAVCEVDDFLDGGTYKKAADQDALYKQWLGDKLAETKREVRRLLHQMAQIRFSVIVGQTWFTEFATIEETIYTLNLPKGEVQCNVEMKEVKVEI
jgi:hypothetical protein